VAAAVRLAPQAADENCVRAAGSITKTVTVPRPVVPSVVIMLKLSVSPCAYDDALKLIVVTGAASTVNEYAVPVVAPYWSTTSKT